MVICAFSPKKDDTLDAVKVFSCGAIKLIKDDIQYVWPFFAVLLGLKANIDSSSQMPMPLPLQLLTNSLNASVNYMSDVFQHPVTKPGCDSLFLLQTISIVNRS